MKEKFEVDQTTYDALKQEEETLLQDMQSNLEKIKFIREILGKATIMEYEYHDDTVNPGDIVEVSFGGDSSEPELLQLIVIPTAFRNDGVTEVSLNSPFGRMLLGAKVGEEAKFPNGQSITIIKKIELDPEMKR